MFWNDIKDIRERISKIEDVLETCVVMDDIDRQIDRIHEKLNIIINNPNVNISENTGSIVRECLEEVFESGNEFSTFNRIHDKLNDLVNDERRNEQVKLAIVTLDKFEDYMKNVDKLNGMVNEFKGCISLARAALEERKRLNDVKDECPITEECLSKINYIYFNMGKFAEFMQNCEKKSPKKRKSTKKTTPSPERT